MANFCPQCAYPVSPHMNACPRCSSVLREAATAVGTQPRPDFGGYGAFEQAAAPVPASYGDYAARAAPVARGLYGKASLGRRFLASCLDGLVGVAAMLPGFATILAGTEGLNGSAFEEPAVALGAVMLVLGICWAIWYGFTKDGGEDGAGYGKRWTGLMVVHLPTNLPVTRGQSALRQLVLMLLNFVPLVGWLIEPIATLADDDGRRLGDKAADTQVIETAEYRPNYRG